MKFNIDFQIYTSYQFFSTQHCLRIVDYNAIDFARAIEYSKTYSISISAPPPSSPKAVSSYLSLILQASVLQSNFLPYLYGMMMMMHAMPLVSNIKNKQNFCLLHTFHQINSIWYTALIQKQSIHEISRFEIRLLWLKTNDLWF